MEKMIFKKLGLGILSVMLFFMTVIFSCKDNEMGTPEIISVHMLDTVARHKDSTFTGAEANTLLVVTGRNIGGITHAYFNGYETSFNTNYNTNTDLIIKIPAEAPTEVGVVDNTIRIVTTHGEATFDFKIITKPLITTIDKLNYGDETGRIITFKGKYFADVEKVVAFRDKDFIGEKVKDSLVCEVISKDKELLSVKIPNNTFGRVTLNITNTSGTNYGSAVFVNMDVSDKIFAENLGSFTSSDGSSTWITDTWANTPTINTDQAYTGQKSISLAFNPGGWSWFGFKCNAGWWPPFHYDTQYKYVTFAIRGGADSFALWISSSATKDGGNGSFPIRNEFQTAAKTWVRYLIPIENIDLFYDGSTIQQIGFRPKGPDKAELIYLDDFMLVK